jgi:hypothetical protein
MKNLTLGLCKGRHEIPQVTEYIFPTIVDPTNLEDMMNRTHEALNDCLHLDLYVTGLSVALATVISYCIINYIPLTLYHYNTTTNSYYQQVIPTTHNMDIIIESGKRGFWK